MKTITEFKNRLHKGVRLHTIYHQFAIGRDNEGNLIFADQDRGVREVNIVQSNAFTLLTEHEGKTIDAWLYYPKASECTFPDKNTITIYDYDFRVREGERPLIPCVTYTFV
jgi:hypothetical protein